MEIERIERTGRGAHGHIGDLQVARRGLQVGVTEQDLDGAKIDAGFEQMGSEVVAQGVITVLTISFPLRSAIAITHATVQRSSLFAI